MQRYLLLIFIISFTFFACKPKKGTEEGIKLNIFVSKITENKIPKELIEYLLPFSDKKDINFAPTLSRLDINFSYEIKVNESNAGLSLATSAKQKKLRGAYENLVLPDSLSIKKQSKNKFTKQEYLKKLKINQTDSTFIFLVDNNNKGYEFLKNDSTKVALKPIKDIESFRKDITQITKKNNKPNIVILFNVEFEIVTDEFSTLKESEQLRINIEAKNDSLKAKQKSKDGIIKEKEELVKLRSTTIDEKDRKSINDQISKLESIISLKDREISTLRTEVKGLEQQLKETQAKLIEEKDAHQKTKDQLIRTGVIIDIGIQETKDEREKRIAAEEKAKKAEEDKIKGDIKSLIKSGRDKTEYIKLENGKLQFYEITDKAEWKKEKIKKQSSLSAQRKKFRGVICDTYKKAFELAKQYKLELDDSDKTEILQKRQIALLLANGAGESFEDNISNGTLETWLNKSCY